MRSQDSDASFHFDTDPDPTFHFDADPDPTFHFDADPDPISHFHFDADADSDPAPHQSDANLRPLVCRHSQALFLGLHAFFVSVHGPPWLHFEPLQLLNFNKRIF